MALVKVGRVGDLRPGKCKVVFVQGRRLALYNVAGQFWATDNACSHQGGPLGEGTLDGSQVVCPWHSWRFEVTTGQCAHRPEVRVDRIPVVEREQELFIEI